MDNFDWEHLEMQPKMALHTKTFQQAYDNRHLTEKEVLARESCQNTRDAGRRIKGITTIQYKENIFTGNEKNKILEILKFHKDFLERFKSSSSKEKSFFKEFEKLVNSNTLTILTISDFNTCGLSGKWDKNTKTDHFGRLVISLGLDDKADGDSNSGGSFGLGKTAYSRVSNVETTFFHSCFQEDVDTAKANRRFMGVGIYPKHDFNSKQFTGFAFYGKLKNGEAEPLINEEAKVISELFDVTRDDEGTDIIIIEPKVTLSEIQESVERYWWPALIRNEIKVEFINNDKKVIYPAPKNQEFIKPFIECFNKIKERSSQDETTLVHTFRSFKEKKMGTLSLKSIDEVEFSTIKNRIAVSRGTGMIIDYIPYGNEKHPSAVGYFEAHKDIHETLILSENPAHCVWESTAQRLIRIFGKEGSERVDKLHTLLKNTFIDFQKKLNKQIITDPKSKGLMSKILGKFLSGGKGKSVPDGSLVPRPFAISLLEKHRDDDKLIYSLIINQNEETPEQDIDITIKPNIYIAGDNKFTNIKLKEITVKDIEDRIIDVGKQIILNNKFSRGNVLQYIIETDDVGNIPYNIRCVCETPNITSELEIENI